MDTNQFWLTKWETKDIFFHRNEVNPDLIELFPKLNLKAGSQIFVPLCGKSRDMLWFIEQGYQVTGIDISPIACEEFFRDQAITPIQRKINDFTEYQYNRIKLYCGDFFKLNHQYVPTIDVIYDAKALIALPPEMQKKYVNHMIQLMGENTQIFLIALETSHNVQGPPYSITSGNVTELYGNNFDIKIMKSQKLTKLADHLIKKGFSDVVETIYWITFR